MARAYGSSATLLLKRETAYGQAAAGDYIRIPFNRCTLGSEQGLIDDPVLGQGRDPYAPLQDVIMDEGEIVVPVDPRYIGLWLTGLFGDPTSSTVAAAGYIDFAVNPSDQDTVTLGGTVWTFVSGTASGDETQIQATATQTIDRLVTDLNASADANIVEATYSRPAGTQRLLVTHDTAGAAGNAFTLAAAAVVSGSTLTGGGNSHVFASGDDDLPSYTVEVGHKQVPAYFRHGGVVIGSIALEFTRAGPAAATIQCVAQGEERFVTSQGGTPSKLDFKRISQFQGSISRGGTPVANLTAGSLTYANNLEKIETIRSDGRIDGADPTVASLTGSIEVRFADTMLIDLASNGTAVDLEFAYEIDGGLKLTFEAHEVYLPKPALTVEGPGGVSARFDFQGARNETEGRMLTVTLVNDLDGSDYA